MTATTPPRWWLPAVSTSAGVVLATLASFYGLRTVVDFTSWWGDGVRFVTVLAVVTLSIRLWMTRSRLRAGEPFTAPATLVPTGVGLVVGVWMFLGTYGSAGDQFTPLVGLRAAQRVAARFDIAVHLVRSEVAPMDATLPVIMLVVGAAALVFLVADLIAGGLHFPALAGIPMLALWATPLLITHDMPVVSVALTALALAGLLAADGARRSTPPRRSVPLRQRAAATGTRVLSATGGAAAAVVIALVVGSAAGGINPVANTSWSSWFAAPGHTVRLSADLDMRRDLNERSGDVVLRYTTSTGADAGPLRAFTLTGFDGTNWHRGSEREGQPIDDPQEVLWPTAGVSDSDQVDTLHVTVGSLRDTRLPIATDPRSVDVDTGTWAYEPLRDEVVGRQSTTTGEAYTMVVHPRTLDADVLRRASGPDPSDRTYLEVPRTTHAAEVKALAEQIAGGEPTRYDQALALQTYFRNTSRFTYDPTIPPPETDDAVWDFLRQRTGYCVQYATAMTVMARMLGIPARLAVGFLPGKETSNGTYEITGKDSHAWPEIYFQGVGWVRFEPTPAQQTGPAPAYAVPVSADSRGPGDRGEVPTPARSGQSVPTTTSSASATTNRADTATGPARSPWIPVGIAAGVVVLLAGLSGWLLRRRRRGEEHIRHAEDAWALTRQSLAELGVEWEPSTTPRQAPRVVATRALDRWGVPVDVSALTELADAVEDARYAPTPRAVSPTELRRWVTDTIAAVTAARDERPNARPAPDDDPNVLRVE